MKLLLSRRAFLHGVSASAILAAAPAQSRMMHGLTAIAPPPKGAVLDGFLSTSYPFKNFIKGTTSFASSPAGYPYPSNLDANGYPTIGTVTTQFGGRFQKAASYTGNWRIKWNGKCKLQLSPGQTPNTGFTVLLDPGGSVSGSTAFNLNITASGTNFVDFQFNGVGTDVNLSFLPGSAGDFAGFSDLRIFRTSAPYAGDEAAIDSGDPLLQFNDDFIAAVVALNPVVIRPLDAIAVSVGNISRYSYLAQPTSMSFNGDRWLPATWAGDTSGTDTYTCAAAPDTPVTWTDGEIFQVRFTNANTAANPTINVNSRGAKTIVNRFAGAITIAGKIAANQLATCVYNALLDKVIIFGSNSDGDLGLVRGWPLSSLTAVANKVKAGLWYTYSHYLNDAGIAATTTFIRDNLSPVYPHFSELSNETWNFNSPVFGLFQALGAALGFPNANGEQEYGWHALRHRQIMGIITPIWSGRLLKRVMAFQCFASQSTNKKYRFEGFDLNSTNFPVYGTYTSGVNYDAFPNRPVDFSDCLSYATYYSGAIMRAFGYTGNPALTAGNLSALTGAADNYASGIPANIASAFAFVDNDTRAGTAGVSSTLGFETLQGLFGQYSAWEAVAAVYPLPVICYEGGFEGLYPTMSDCATLGSPLVNSATVTFNIGSSPGINWTAFPNANGDKFLFTSTGSGPGNIAQGGDYFIVNAGVNGFDISITQGGTPITLTGSPTGTATGKASKYADATGTIAAMLTAYKLNVLFKQLVLDQWAQFQGTFANSGAYALNGLLPHSSYPAWYSFDAFQWSMYRGSLDTTPFQSYNAFAQFSAH